MIPFNKPYLTGREEFYLHQACVSGQLAGNKTFSKKCHAWLESSVGCTKAMLTQTCTGALEMAAMLLDIRPGDEVICPSFTYVSTALAFVLRGAVPVFVDIDPITFNIDPSKIEAAITERTRAIVVVHYGGVACDMDAIMRIAHSHKIFVIEDAAQALLSHYKGRPLGSFADVSVLSFHETKNIISGEGGALLVNRADLMDRADCLAEVGTNRTEFFRHQTEQYTWVDVGSSFYPSELIAAFLWAQLEEAEDITRRRVEVWNRYHQALSALCRSHDIQLPCLPEDIGHNGHLYWLLFPESGQRDWFIEEMMKQGIQTVFHYVPLHTSPAGQRYGRMHGDLSVTNAVASRIVRLPLWPGVEEHQDHIIKKTKNVIQTMVCVT